MQTLDEFNRNQRLANFPPDKRWARVEGVLPQQLSKPGEWLISIGGRDHTGAEVRFWTDIRHAMYLMNLLAHVQRESGARVPSECPPDCKPYDGN
jgi:hypothetical protein